MAASGSPWVAFDSSGEAFFRNPARGPIEASDSPWVMFDSSGQGLFRRPETEPERRGQEDQERCSMCPSYLPCLKEQTSGNENINKEHQPGEGRQRAQQTYV